MRRPVPTSDRLLTNLDFHPRIGLRAAETCGQSSWVDAASSVLMNPRLVSNLNFFFFSFVDHRSRALFYTPARSEGCDVVIIQASIDDLTERRR